MCIIIFIFPLVMNFGKLQQQFEKSKTLASDNVANEPPTLFKLIEKRDFTGAIILLQF